MPRTHSIAVIAGDGIGTEVVPPALEILDATARRFGFVARTHEYDWGTEYYQRSGRMMPEDGLDQLSEHDSILFGAVGSPDLDDTVTLWGLLIPIRRGFNQYVNLRPARHVAGVPSPLRSAAGIDIMIVRENVEGEYSEVGTREGRGASEKATQVATFTRTGVERVARFAADLAESRSGRLTSATKSNGLLFSMPFWDDVVAEVCAGRPVELRRVLIDALSARLITHPLEFDVIVASNLFGDILSDLAAACVGSLGLAASANLNPEREHPSLFEPVHGSAPDIAGKGVANPLAQISATAMLLRHLEEHSAADLIDEAVETVLREGPRTPDLSGTGTTTEVAAAVLNIIEN